MAQVCKAGVARLRKIWLTRHGESEYNEMALIGGNSNLTPAGQIYARLLPDAIVDRVPLVRRPRLARFARSHVLKGRLTPSFSRQRAHHRPAGCAALPVRQLPRLQIVGS